MLRSKLASRRVHEAEKIRQTNIGMSPRRCTFAPTTPPSAASETYNHARRTVGSARSRRETQGAQEKAKMVDRSTNTATSAPHRSHAVAGWSQAAGTPHDPLPLATPQALRNSAEGSGGAAGDEPR